MMRDKLFTWSVVEFSMIQDGPCAAAGVSSGSQGMLGLCSLSPRALEVWQKGW